MGIIKKIEKEVEKDIVKGEEVLQGLVENVEEKIGLKPKKAKKTSIPKPKNEGEEELSGKELEIEAERESILPDIERKKKELLEKVKKLKEKVLAEAISTEELKEKVKAKKKGEMLVPLEEYVKSGIYLGTKVVTPNMRQFVYRRRADGLAIFNTDIIDEKLKEGIEFLSKFNAEDIILVCKRQAGWKTAEMFGKITGIRVFWNSSGWVVRRFEKFFHFNFSYKKIS